MANSFEEVGKKAKDLLVELTTQTGLLNTKLIESVNNINKLSSSDAGKNQSATKQKVSDIDKEIQKTKELEQELRKNAEARRKLIVARQNDIKEGLKQQKLEQKSRESLDKQRQAALGLMGAYNQLISKQKEAKRVLQDLIVSGKKAGQSQRSHNNELKKAQREYDKYTAKVNQANRATSNFAKTGLGGLARGFRNLLSAFGLVGGLMIFANLTKEGFKLAKKLDSLSFAMGAVITDTYELARAQSFLADISERYGAGIVSLTERYIKFTAAAQQAKVSSKDIEQIFGSFTKISGVLGLKEDELNGVFLALEQMLSKGKVTTEELRRQLGERLPGAFGIMAQTLQLLNPDMEITVQKLDDMLRAGSVLSAEVLPEFAKQAERALGTENINRVETLNASTTRLSNAWIKLVGSITEGGGLVSKVLVTMIDGFASFIKLLTVDTLTVARDEFQLLSNSIYENAKSSKLAATAASTLLKEYQNLTDKGVKPTVKEKERLDEIILLMTDHLGDSVTAIDEETGALHLNVEAVKLNIKAKLLASDAEASELASRLVNAKLEKKVLEENIPALERDYETRKRIADQARENLRASEEFQKASERGRLSRLANLPEVKKEQEAFKALNSMKGNINEQEKRRIDLVTKLKDFNYSEETISKLFDASKTEEEIDDLTQKILPKLRAELAQYKKELKELGDVENLTVGQEAEFHRLTKAISDTESAIESFTGKLKKSGSSTKGREKIVSVIESETKAVDSLVLEVQKQIDIYEKVLEMTPKMTKEYKFLEKQIENLKDALEGFDPKVSDEEMEGLQRWSEGFSRNADSIRDRKNKLEDELEDFFGGFQDDFMSEAGFEKLNELFLKLDEDGISKFSKLLEASGDDWKVYFNSIAEVAQETFNFLNSQSQASFDKQYEQLEKQKEIALMFAGESAAAKEQIEEQYEARRKAIQDRQARSQKKMALFNTAINTAQAVVSALASSPPPANFIIAGIVGAIGAAQLSMIASTPVPEFFRGTMNAPEGWAMVDEKRPEIHTDNKGNVKSAGENKANMRYLNRGDKIYSSHEEYFNKELGSVLGQNDIMPYNKMFDVSPMINIEQGDNSHKLISEIRSLKSVIANKESGNVNIDKNGIKTYVSKGHSKTVSLNNRVTFKGTSV